MAMKWLAAVALLVAGMGLPACGQRGGGARGGVVRIGTSSGGGMSLGSPFAYASPRVSSVSTLSGRSYPGGAVGSRSGYPVRRPVYGGIGRRAVGYLQYGVALPYAGVGWFGPDYYGYSDQPVDPGQAYPSPAPQPYYPGDDAAGYGTAPNAQAVAASQTYAQTNTPASSPPEEAVTLIFEDGRPSEQIHNYILTPKMLYVQDDHHRVIPVDQIDLASTETANLKAGVEFRLPTASR
jgi:hypothetical protein